MNNNKNKLNNELILIYNLNLNACLGAYLVRIFK